MIKKHALKRCSTTVVFRGMEINTTTRHHFTPKRMAKMKKQTIPSVGEDVEKLEPSYIAGGM